MKIFVSATFNDMSKIAFDSVSDLVRNKIHPLICPASGDSPAGLYKEMVTACRDNKINFADWNFVGLDEWVGMNETDNGSCRYHLNQQLFEPLKIQPQKICFFNGRAGDLDGECSKVEEFIERNGGIDVAIIGIGLNGHIGMNEPGTSPQSRSHIAAIDPITQQVGQKYFTEAKQLTTGLTLGIANILAAKNVILLVGGKHKASIIKQALEGEPTIDLPASLLQKHPSFFVFLDEEAASLLNKTI